MKNGKLEPNDSDTLQNIYNKLTVNGELKEQLTAEEQVLLFSVSKWIKKNVKKDNMTKDCNKCIFTQLSHLGIIHYQDRPCTQRRIILLSLDGNTVTYIKDGQIKRVTCGQHEEAVEFYEEVRHEQRKI